MDEVTTKSWILCFGYFYILLLIQLDLDINIPQGMAKPTPTG